MVPNKKIVLTGAGGFLGKFLAPKLLEHNVTLIAVTSRSQCELENLCGIGALGTSVEVVSPSDSITLKEAMQGADLLLNCAFPRNEDGGKLAQGLDFIREVFQLAAECGVGAVVNVSSQSVYDPHRSDPAEESSPLRLESKYAVAKYSTELMLKAACPKIPQTNIRLASLIGPGFDQRVVNKFIDLSMANGELKIVEGNSRFGYLDVRDAADAIAILAFSDPVSWRECYNLGPCDSWTLEEMANIVANVIGERLGKGVSITAAGIEKERKNSALDSKLFYHQFEWKPRNSLNQSIEYIVEEKAHGCMFYSRPEYSL